MLNYAIRTNSTSFSLGSGGGASIGQGSFNFSSGASKSSVKGETAFVDVNGDGLPDFIKSNHVYINTGLEFVEDLNFIKNSPLAANDFSVSKTKLTGTNINAAATVAFNLPFVKIVVNAGVFFSSGSSRSEATFMDINGDGYADYLEKGSDTSDDDFTGDSDVTVYLSKLGRTNKLKSVINHIGGFDNAGGTYKIDYGLSAATVDHPGGKWVMNDLMVKESTNDVYAPPIHTKFDYRKGKYERCERQFLGFGEVEVDEMDGYRKTISTYHNKDVYRSGRMVSSKVIDGDSDDWVETITTYEAARVIPTPDFTGSIIDLDLYDSRTSPQSASIFVAPKSSKTLLHYGSEVGYVGESSTMSYDAVGNLTMLKYANNGNDVTKNEAEDYTVSMTYHTAPLGTNIIAMPSSHSVTENGSQLRSSSYPGITQKGSIKVHFVWTSGGFALTEYTYDQYGNVKTMTAPENNMAQRVKYEYTYDDIVYTYPTLIEQFEGTSLSAKYTSLFEDYNFAFGLVGKETSIHGYSTEYKYDKAGRLKKIMGPKNLNVKFDYDLPNKKATTYRSVPAIDLSDNIIESYVFVDGLGRSLGEGTQSLVDGNLVIIWSGVPTYDGVGRLISTSRPIIGNDMSPTKGEELSATTYDFLDRPLLSTNLGQNYGYIYDFDGGLLSTQITDPNDHKTINLSEYNGAVWQSTRENDSSTGSDIVTKYEYDGIDQLKKVIAPNGLETTYIYGPDGKVKTKSNPDIGTHSYDYDPMGNKTGHTEGNWSAKYTYDFYRLTEINYLDGVEAPQPDYKVTYMYGDQYGDQNSRDRIISQLDISGEQHFEYDELGAVKKHTRDYAIPLVTDRARFVTEWIYDAWNRVQKITYPDLEEVSYKYDVGGNLFSVEGKKSEVDYPYINSITYDVYGQRKSVELGNEVAQTYTYFGDTRFLKKMQSGINNCDYGYDAKGNVISKTNSSPLGSGGATYEYDSFDRIKSSLGNWSGIDGDYAYDNTYKFDGAGNFEEKNSLITRTDPNYPMGLSKNSMKTYKYVTANGGATNQIKYVTEDYQERFGTDPLALTGINRLTSHQYRGTPEPGDEGMLGENVTRIDRHAVEKNFDNNVESTISNPSLSQTGMVYQTENRLGAINIDNNINHYFYDGAGERFLKMKETFQDIYVNGELSGNEILPIDYTFYVSPLLVIRPGSYTKHIYVGSDRIVSKIGEPKDYEDPTAEAASMSTNKKSMEKILNTNYADLRVDISIGDFTRVQHDPSTVFGFDKTSGATENDQYFFSKDHLGSSHFMTNKDGDIISHSEYMPFGETYVDWSKIDWKTPYRFTGQEQDCETGLYYYGARYYDPGVGQFLSVDPMMDRAPGWSPYNYTFNNPVKYVDPDGKWPILGMILSYNDNPVGFTMAFNFYATQNQAPQGLCYAVCKQRFESAYSQVKGNSVKSDLAQGSTSRLSARSAYSHLFNSASQDNSNWKSLPENLRDGGGAGAITNAGFGEMLTENQIWDGDLKTGAIIQVWNTSEGAENVKNGIKQGEYASGHSFFFLGYEKDADGNITGVNIADQWGEQTFTRDYYEAWRAANITVQNDGDE